MRSKKFKKSSKNKPAFFRGAPLPKNIMIIGSEIVEYSREPREGFMKAQIRDGNKEFNIFLRRNGGA